MSDASIDASLTYADLAARLWPHLLERLRGLASPEARALAESASFPDLDAVAIHALADWMEERRMPTLAADMRRLAIADGTLLVIECEEHFSAQQRSRIRDDLMPVVERLREGGRRIELVVLARGLTFRVIHASGKGVA